MRVLNYLKRLSAVAALGMYLLGAGSAHAGPIFTYDPFNSSVTLTPTGGLSAGDLPTAQVNQATNIVFELSSLGQDFAFEFLTITSGSGTEAFVGTAEIEATLAFSTPSVVTGSGAGNGSGFSIGSWFGYLSAGSVVWEEQPGDIAFSDGTVVNLSFGNDSQSIWDGLSGLNLSVAATTTLQAIPEPSMLALMGIGLVGAGFVSRRRRIL